MTKILRTHISLKLNGTNVPHRRLQILVADHLGMSTDRVACMSLIGAPFASVFWSGGLKQCLPLVGTVIDISMPQINGIEAAIKMRENGSQAKVVFLTVNEDSDFVRAALRTGALGYVLKSRMASDLCGAINGAILGNLFVSPSCFFSADLD